MFIETRRRWFVGWIRCEREHGTQLDARWDCFWTYIWGQFVLLGQFFKSHFCIARGFYSDVADGLISGTTTRTLLI